MCIRDRFKIQRISTHLEILEVLLVYGELELVLKAGRAALEICAAASHLGAKGFIRRDTGTWPWRMLLQLFSADDVDIFGGADAMHSLMSDPLFGHSAGAWLGDPGERPISDEAKRRRAEPAAGIRLMEWACGLRALFSVPVYAAFAESHDFIQRVLGLEGVQSAAEHVAAYIIDTVLVNETVRVAEELHLARRVAALRERPVSYTHLTLPTILLV